MDTHCGLEMIVVIPSHGTDDAEIVNDTAHIREEIADFDAALAVAGGAPRRTHEGDILHAFFAIGSGFGESRLGI
ncbi:hypothetical protein NL529_28490, partial [Klebsiella pneumoniae]|nr:hypothetical protein [Klebsiella pneumoniae]